MKNKNTSQEYFIKQTFGIRTLACEIPSTKFFVNN